MINHHESLTLVALSSMSQIGEPHEGICHVVGVSMWLLWAYGFFFLDFLWAYGLNIYSFSSILSYMSACLSKLTGFVDFCSMREWLGKLWFVLERSLLFPAMLEIKFRVPHNNEKPIINPHKNAGFLSFKKTHFIWGMINPCL